MRTSYGSDMYCLTKRRISLGMVAENSQVRFVSGVMAKIVSSSSLNPMLSISSASSRTTHSIWSRAMAPRLARSINRPGVAMTTWHALRS